MALIGTPQLKSSSSRKDDGYNRSGSRTYLVFATTDFDEVHVLVHLGIDIFNTHPSDNRQVVKGISLELHHGQMVLYDSLANQAGASPAPPPGTACYCWVATVEYGPWNPLEHTDTGDPKDQPTKVYFEGQTFQEIADVTIEGDPVVNSAYDPFDPPIMRDRTRPVLKIVRNEDTFTASTILAYADKVNSDAVGPYPARTLKVSAPVGQPLYSQFTGNTYYEVTYLVHHNPDTWAAQPLDQGLRELDPADATKRRQILTEDGMPAAAPILLDGTGHALLPPVAAAEVNYLNFNIYHEINFGTSFNFPTGTFT